MKLQNYFEVFKKSFNEKDSISERIDQWYTCMKQYENLRNMCINDYTIEGYDWREIAYNKVFNYNLDYFVRMDKTTELISEITDTIENKLDDFYSDKYFEPTIIVYHGLGNAAGWATEYMGNQTILLGVEKIVELNWDNKSKIEDLISHEIGHIIHQQIRKEPLDIYDDFGRKYIFRLYTEGVATYCENLLNGRRKATPDWYEKALRNESQVKQEFLKKYHSNDYTIIDFFGDWNPILGIPEAGYFLGLRVVEKLIEELSLFEIMTLDLKNICHYFFEYLKEV